MMFTTAFLILFLAISPSLVVSLECYDGSLIMLNYTLTSETVPSFDKSVLKSVDECMIMVDWYQNPPRTTISILAVEDRQSNTSFYDSLNVYLGLSDDIFETNVTNMKRSLLYSCKLSNTCNNETALKSVLQALVLEENFSEDFYSLISVEKFDNNTAATCLRYTNVTHDCPMPSFQTCRRCITNAYRSSSGVENICATCDPFNVISNDFQTSFLFILNNRTQAPERTLLRCQKEGCNSMENINKIRRATTITFDFDQFYNVSSVNTTTTAVITSSTTVATTTSQLSSANIASLSAPIILLALFKTFQSFIAF